MCINQYIELTMQLNHDDFQNVFSRSYHGNEYLDENTGECCDNSISEKGILVIYHNGYKKKIRLVICTDIIMDGESTNAGKLVHRIEKYVSKYFGGMYELNDFKLKRVRYIQDIKLDGGYDTTTYIRLFRKLGKVKGFTPKDFDSVYTEKNYCVKGNSNGISVLIYDLSDHLLNNDESDHKVLKQLKKKSADVLRLEVWLSEPKSVDDYADVAGTSECIEILTEEKEKVFLNALRLVVPTGDYYKKTEAIDIIRKNVNDLRLLRRMICLMVYIIDKKSLLLAQKSMRYRKIDKVMGKFAEIELSPVTIPKRMKIKYVPSIYNFLG